MCLRGVSLFSAFSCLFTIFKNKLRLGCILALPTLGQKCIFSELQPKQISNFDLGHPVVSQDLNRKENASSSIILILFRLISGLYLVHDIAQLRYVTGTVSLPLVDTFLSKSFLSNDEQISKCMSVVQNVIEKLALVINLVHFIMYQTQIQSTVNLLFL